MYGLILEGIRNALVNRFGAQVTAEILKNAGVNHESFEIKKKYSESLVPRIIQATRAAMNVSADDILSASGEEFLIFLRRFEYNKLLEVKEPCCFSFMTNYYYLSLGCLTSID